MGISCAYGSVGKILDYGVNSENMGSPADACVNNSANQKCRPTSSRIDGLVKAAVGKDSYHMQFSESDLYNGTPASVC